MDQYVMLSIEKMLRHNIVCSDVWIARRLKNAGRDMAQGVAIFLEHRGKRPHVSQYVGSNGRVGPRDFDRVPQPAA